MKKLLITFITLGAILAHAQVPTELPQGGGGGGTQNALTVSNRVQSFHLNPLEVCLQMDQTTKKFTINPLCIQRVVLENAQRDAEIKAQELIEAIRTCGQPGLPTGSIVGTNPECISELSI